MFKKLEEYLHQRVEIAPSALAQICAKFKPLKVKRNAFLLREGEVCKHYYFVNAGCLRLFNVNKEGQEGTRYLAFEGSFGTALPSLIDQKPAFEFLQALEPSELLVIQRADFFELVDTVPQFGFIYRRILELAFVTAQERIYGFQGLEAVDKVRWLLAYQPWILSRVSNKIVASYLGISPATLSRLKAKL